MTATQKSDAPAAADEVRLRVRVFDALMSTRGHHTVAAQAEAMDVHRSTLFRIRSGETVPNLELAMKMASACGTTVEVLFERVQRVA